MTSRSNAAPGRFGLLDVVVLIAMAVTATAFAAGLIINSGIDMMAGVIAGAALFIVMASSHYVITRQARSATVAGRLDELEEALVVLDGDLQRIDQVEDDVARLDLLTDRVERLDQAVSEYGGGAPATGATASWSPTSSSRRSARSGTRRKTAATPSRTCRRATRPSCRSRPSTPRSTELTAVRVSTVTHDADCASASGALTASP